MMYIRGHRYANYPDVYITIINCIHVLKCHTVPHKYIQLLCVKR